MVVSPAYLVEGDLEQRFIQSVCSNQPVQKIGLNGKSVSIPAIAKRIGTQARLLQRHHNPLVVVFDREARVETCAQIEAMLRDLLRSEDVNADILIGIADREIENWLLADWETFRRCSSCTVENPPNPVDGAHGKKQLKQLLPQGATYTETIEGAAWLKKCIPQRIAENSQSFANFLAQMRGLECWWLSERVP
jgi:Domain of unknown function (DUF4276)